MEKEKGIEKKHIPLLIIIFLLLAFVLWRAVVSERENSGDNEEELASSADITMEFCKDGDVQITERWKVSFSDQGEFDTFRRIIELKETGPDKLPFVDLSSVRVSIDGRQSTKLKSTGSIWESEAPYKDDTFIIERNPYFYNLYCYKTEKNDTHNYVISYTMREAVMNVDNDYNLFLYSQTHYPYIIKQLSFRIIVPEGSRPDIKNGKLFGLFKEVRVKDNIAEITGWEDCSEDLLLRVRIDGGGIQGAIPVNSEDVYEAYDEGISLGIGNIIALIFPIAAIVFIICMIMIRRINRRNINMDYLPHGLRQKDLLKIPELYDLKIWLNWAGGLQIFIGLLYMLLNGMITDELWKKGYGIPTYIILLILAFLTASGIVLLVRKTVLSALLVAATSLFCFVPPYISLMVTFLAIIGAIVLEKVWLEYRFAKK